MQTASRVILKERQRCMEPSVRQERKAHRQITFYLKNFMLGSASLCLFFFENRNKKVHVSAIVFLMVALYLIVVLVPAIIFLSKAPSLSLLQQKEIETCDECVEKWDWLVLEVSSALQSDICQLGLSHFPLLNWLRLSFFLFLCSMLSLEFCYTLISHILWKHSDLKKDVIGYCYCQQNGAHCIAGNHFILHLCFSSFALCLHLGCFQYSFCKRPTTAIGALHFCSSSQSHGQRTARFFRRGHFILLPKRERRLWAGPPTLGDPTSRLARRKTVIY